MLSLSVNEICSLAARLKEGDKDVFTRLYESTADPQYFTALSILKDSGLAEDAVQTVYMQVYRNISKLASTEHFLPWLSRITYNTCLGILRIKKKNKADLDEEMLYAKPDPDPDINPLPLVVHKENETFLLSLLDQLSLEHRTIIILRFYQELKVKEIARIMDVSEGTVKSRLHYALKKLKSILKDNGCHGTESLLGAGVFLRHTFRVVKGPKDAGKLLSRKHVSECAKAVSVSAAACVVFMGTVGRYPAEELKKVQIQNADVYTNKQAEVKITAEIKDSSHLEAKYDDGENLKITRQSRNSFTVQAGRNGKIKICLKNGRSVKDEKEISVTQIDRKPPVIKKAVHQGTFLRVYLEDDVSGVDYQKIEAMHNGQPLQIPDINSAENYIELPGTASGSIQLVLKDMAGNEDGVRLKRRDRISQD